MEKEKKLQNWRKITVHQYRNVAETQKKTFKKNLNILAILKGKWEKKTAKKEET